MLHSAPSPSSPRRSPPRRSRPGRSTGSDSWARASPCWHARLVEALPPGLRELGYVEGQNIVIEYRVRRGEAERLPDLAAELVR